MQSKVILALGSTTCTLLLVGCAHPGPPVSPQPIVTVVASAPDEEDRGAYFGSSRCAQAGVAFCDGFETGVLDPDNWRTSGPPPTIETAQHARGSQALHVVRRGNGQSLIRSTRPFPIPQNRYFGRAFVYFNNLPTAPMKYAHWTIIAGMGIASRAEIRIGGQLQGGLNTWGIGTDNRAPDGTGDWTNSDKGDSGHKTGIPEKQWICLEWLHDGQAHETRTWIDGVERTALQTTADKHGGKQDVPYRLPIFSSVWFGWQEYQPSTQTFDLWLDELALDVRRIGCLK